MSQLKINPQFEIALYRSVKMFVQEYFRLATEIIETDRYWDGWETSNPYRDIVDTSDLKNSGRIEQLSESAFKMKWVTDYVTFVYFGYFLQDGRRIPARKWVELVMQENNMNQIALNIFRLNLK